MPRYTKQVRLAIAGSKRGTEETRRNPDRWVYAQSLRDAGHTLADIGKALGVSAERVRQMTKPSGENGGRLVDPIAIMRALRDPTVTSVPQIEARCGTTTAIECLTEMGLRDAALRLLRWRRTFPSRQRYRSAVEREVNRLGRVPTYSELDKALGISPGASAPLARSIFGDCAAMWRYVGLTPRERGSPGHVSVDSPTRTGARSDTCFKGHTKQTTPSGRRRCPTCAKERHQGRR